MKPRVIFNDQKSYENEFSCQILPLCMVTLGKSLSVFELQRPHVYPRKSGSKGM